MVVLFELLDMYVRLLSNSNLLIEWRQWVPCDVTSPAAFFLLESVYKIFRGSYSDHSNSA